LVGLSRIAATLVSVTVTGAMLLGVGIYEARTTASAWWASGGRMLLIGLGAGFAGFLVGKVVGAF
jgi:VIT1/CCC1 family predicted Fe2+/Mn2+ transporter